MQCLPVIDLMQGQVVHAVRGQRHAYRAIVSPLCAGSDPVDIARALCDAAASACLYVADLDALTGHAPQAEAVQALLQAWPELTLWLDAGFSDAAATHRALARLGADAQRVRPVWASEALHSLEALEQARAMWPHGLLSLDARDGQPVDPAGCWNAPHAWPRDVIVMTLDRVGTAAGPDVAAWAAVHARARPGSAVYGAGGVRSDADLDRAAAAGAAGWLVASALHHGTVRARGHGAAGR